MPMVISVIFFVIYYVISISGEKLAKEGTWSSLLGMWISSIVLAPLAAFLTHKATNDSALLDVDWYIGRIKHYQERFEAKLPEKWQRKIAARRERAAAKQEAKRAKHRAKMEQKRAAQGN